jgi:hypothetical protein
LGGTSRVRTYPLRDESGRFYAFEIGNAWVSPRSIAKLLKSTLRATVSSRKNGLGRDDVRLRFSYGGDDYEVYEPFGDNSRYWVGPSGEHPERASQIEEIHKAFLAHRVTLVARLAAIFGL